MLQSYTYYFVNLFCILVPFIFSFHPKIKFYLEWKSFFIACCITALVFIIWDAEFTRIGVWSFNEKYTRPQRIAGLPIEEILFFICIPYACMFTYHCFKNFFTAPAKSTVSLYIAYGLIVFLISVGIFNLPRLYTSITFIALAAWLFMLCILKVNFLHHFFIMYAVILIPFFISNGILTGSFTAEPVVIYNNNHNLAIRIFTIPIEDTFYGMLLVLMNVSILEFINKKNINTVTEKNYSFKHY